MVIVTDDLVASMVKAIVREVDPETVYLFGSRASGDAGAASDVDLLIVEREPFGAVRSRWNELTKLWNVVAKFRVAVDILLYSRDEVEQWRQSATHVVGVATREGKVLYERP